MPQHHTFGRFTLAGTCIGLVASSLSVLGLASDTKAQSVQVAPIPAEVRVIPIPAYNPISEGFGNAYYYSGRDYFTNRNPFRQFNYMFGITGFPENEVSRDSREVYRYYRRALAAQLSSTPIIRTPDLPTPFPESLLTLPVAQPSRPAVPIAAPPIIETVPPSVTPLPPQQGPVPALW